MQNGNNCYVLCKFEIITPDEHLFCLVLSIKKRISNLFNFDTAFLSIIKNNI